MSYGYSYPIQNFPNITGLQRISRWMVATLWWKYVEINCYIIAHFTTPVVVIGAGATMKPG